MNTISPSAKDDRVIPPALEQVTPFGCIKRSKPSRVVEPAAIGIGHSTRGRGGSFGLTHPVRCDDRIDQAGQIADRCLRTAGHLSDALVSPGGVSAILLGKVTPPGPGAMH